MSEWEVTERLLDSLGYVAGEGFVWLNGQRAAEPESARAHLSRDCDAGESDDDPRAGGQVHSPDRESFGELDADVAELLNDDPDASSNNLCAALRAQGIHVRRQVALAAIRRARDAREGADTAPGFPDAPCLVPEPGNHALGGSG